MTILPKADDDITKLRTVLDASANAAENTAVSPNFLVLTFYVNAQFPYNFGKFVSNSEETVRFHKILHQKIR